MRILGLPQADTVGEPSPARIMRKELFRDEETLCEEEKDMSLKPEPIHPIPQETARVAKAAFPKGSIFMRMRDELGILSQDEAFAALFPQDGQPALAPWRLALITILYGFPSSSLQTEWPHRNGRGKPGKAEAGERKRKRVKRMSVGIVNLFLRDKYIDEL
jgi:hypothetical protein